MKKIITSLCLSAVSVCSFSQIGPYVSFNTGVATSTSQDVVGTNSVSTSGGDFTTTNVYGSFGSGLNFTLRTGFKATQNFGGELGIGYLYGFNNTIGESTGPNSEQTIKAQAFQLRVMPALVFETTNEALTLYSKVGLVLPVGGKTVGEIYNKTVTGNNTSEVIIRNENKGKLSLGYFGAFGASLKVADNLKAFAEVEVINLRVKQKSQQITEYTIDGQDQLEALPTSAKETEYVDEIKSSDNTNNAEPKKVLAARRNFNSIGLNIGIRFNF